MTLSADQQKVLDDIIINDEGGWVLTPSSISDPSGGWTYAGVTASTWNSIFTDNKLVTFAEANLYFSTKNPFMQNIYEIYENEYVIASKLSLLPTYLWTPYLSLAINRGVGNAVKALQGMINIPFHSTPLEVDGDFGPETEEMVAEFKNISYAIEDVDYFCQLWRLQYASLVASNSVFGADLAGWLNRVERCRLAKVI